MKKSRTINSNTNTRALIEELEPRILLSAGLEAYLIADNPFGDPNQTVTQASLNPDTTASEQTSVAALLRHEIVFVDTQTPDYQQLVDDLIASNSDQRQLDVIILDSSQDGMQQISGTLTQYQNLDAVHIISHGSDNAIQLGQIWLTTDNLDDYVVNIELWQTALSEQADILIYGCNLASSAEGQLLVNTISQLSGADVAASDDMTGNALLGGDWQLEHQVGTIESSVVFSKQAQQNWHGILAASTVADDFSSADYSGNTGSANWTGNWVEIGEGDGSGIGNVQVSTGSLDISLSEVSAQGALREADISAGLSATLSFDYQRNQAGPGGSFSVAISGDGGLNWTTLSTYNINADDASPIAASFDISSYIATNTQVRFMGAASGSASSFTIDNVNIEYATSQNISPVNSVPGTQTTSVNTDLVFSSANANQISISDVDAGSNSVEVTLTATNGVLTLAGTPTLPYTSVDGEHLINTATNNTQSNSSIAMDANGNYVVIWQSTSQDGSGEGIFGQLFDANCVAQGNEFKVNTYTTNDQSVADVAMDTNGNFVVVWQSAAQDSDGTTGIYAQRYNASGMPEGSEFRVNSTQINDQTSPAIAMDDTGMFVITWSSNMQDGSGTGIYAQRYNTSGVAQGDEFQVNTTTSGNQAEAAIAMDSLGNFIIAWSSATQDTGGNSGIYAQRYDASGVTQGDEFKVNTTTAGDQINPTVAMDSTGNFVIAWTGVTQDTNSTSGIYAQRYNASGIPQDNEFHVNSVETNEQYQASVAMADNGNFMIAWSDGWIDNNTGIGVQFYDANGVTQGSHFAANTTTSNSQAKPAIAMNVQGAVITWEGNGIGDSSGIQSQHYTADLFPSLSFTTGDGLNDSSITFTGTLTDINNALDGLIFTPTMHYNGTGTLTVTTDDLGNSGTGGALIDSDVINITVGTGNSPTATNNTVTTNEDTIYTFTVLDFNYSDVDGNPMTQVQITALESAGTLQLSGADVTLNQVISKAEINAGKLKFIPATNANGLSYDSFGFKVHDGTSYSTSSYMMTMDVTAVNDLPIAENSTVITSETTAYIFGLNDFGFSDVDGDTMNLIKITSLPSNSTLFVGANPVTINQFVVWPDIQFGNFKIIPNAGSGPNFDSFNYQVHDGSGFSTNAYTMTLAVNPASNNAPTASNNTVTTNEDTRYSFVAGDFGFADVDGDSLTQIQITTLGTMGSLQLAGVDVTQDQVISLADITAGNLTFTPNANAHGLGYDSFGFKVHDGTIYSAAAYTLTVDVTAVNDAPTSANQSIQLLSDEPYQISLGDLNFSDVDIADTLSQIQITSLPVNSSLLLSGIAVVNNQIIDISDIMAGNLTYTALTGTTTDNLMFKVHDGTAFSSASYSITFNSALDPVDTVIAPVDAAIIYQMINPGPQVSTNPASSSASMTQETAPDAIHQNTVISAVNTINSLADSTVLPSNNLNSGNIQSGNTIHTMTHLTDDQSVSLNIDSKAVADSLISQLQPIDTTKENVLLSSYGNNPLDNQKFFAQIELLQSEIEDEIEKSAAEHMARAATLATGGITVTAGALSSVLRGGSLLTSLLSILPVWKGFDPLPILAGKKKDEAEEIVNDKNVAKHDNQEIIIGKIINQNTGDKLQSPSLVIHSFYA